MVTAWLWRWRAPRRRLWSGSSPDDSVFGDGRERRPRPRAGALCHRRLAEHGQRDGPLGGDCPRVTAELPAQSFCDQSVAFANRQYVLENAGGPGAALEELVRRGRVGYIEMPVPPWKRLAGRSCHGWLVESNGDELACTAKPPCTRHLDLPLRVEALACPGWSWPTPTLEQPDDSRTPLMSRDRIEHEVHSGAVTPGEGIGTEPLAPWLWDADSREGLPRALKPPVMSLLCWFLPTRGGANLHGLTACTFCYGASVREGGGLSCQACRVRYPTCDRIHVLPRIGAQPLGAERTERKAALVAAATRS